VTDEEGRVRTSATVLADQDRCYAVLARRECHDHQTAYVADERQIDNDGTVAIVEGNAGDVEARSGSGCVPCRVADEDGPGLRAPREPAPPLSGWPPRLL
jgi:hypothetical protein